MTRTQKTSDKLKVAKTGIGLRAFHTEQILAEKPDVGFVEAHSENYFRLGGIPFEQLMKAREVYPLSLHGVGLSLGSAEGVSDDHLAKLAALVKEAEPVLVSEHISWSTADGKSVPDLLPLPMTKDALDALCKNIAKVQDALKRQILVENPSSYLAFADRDMTEPQFIAEVVKRTGCGLLLDVNNIHVSAHNLGFDPREYLAGIPAAAVQEIHLAGYHINEAAGREIFVDAHNHAVYDGVWTLYAAALEKLGDVPTLVEWDSDLPPLNVLVAEAKKADKIRETAAKGKGNARVA
jgi:uncharacterized protein